MNKSDLIETLSEKLGGKSAATAAVEHFVDTVTRAVATGEKVAITGFGVFEKADRAARTGRNPATGATVRIKATSVPKFRPGAEFKAVVSGAKKVAKRAATKAAPVRKAAAKKVAPARKAAPVKKAAPTKTTAARTLAKKTTAPAKKSTAAKTLASKAPAKKAAVKQVPAKKAAAKKAPAKKATKRGR